MYPRNNECPSFHESIIIARHRIVSVPDAALVDALDERRDCVAVRRRVERRPDGRRVDVVRRGGRVRQRVMVVEVVMVGLVAVSEVSLQLERTRARM